MAHKGMYNDTLSRCRTYSNPYDIRSQSHPAIIKHRAEAYNNSRDVLESSQARLEKELLSRLQAKNFRIPIGTLVVIAKMGKYAFLAITLPLYLFCYGIPKWLMVELFPKMYGLSKGFSRRVTNKVSLVAHKCVAALKYLQTITSPILMFIKTQIEQTRELFSRMKEGFLKMASYPFRLMADAMKDFNSKLAGVFDKMKQAQEKVLAFSAFLGRGLSAVAKTLTEVFSRLDALRQYLQRPGLLAKSMVAKIAEVYAKIAETTQRMIDGVLDRVVYSPFEMAKDAFNRMREKTARLVEKITDPVLQWISPKAEVLAKALKKGKEWADNFKERSKEKFRERAKQIVDRADRAIKATAKGAEAVVHQLAQLIPQPVLSLFIPLMTFAGKVVGAPLGLYRSRKKIKEKMKRLKERSKRGLNTLSRWVLKEMTSFGRALHWFISKMMTSSKRGFNFLKKVCLFVKNALMGAFFLLRLILAWARVLFRYGMLLVRELTRRLFATVP